MKKISIFLLLFLIIFQSFAFAESTNYLRDDFGHFSDEDINKIENKLIEISDKHDTNITVFISNSGISKSRAEDYTINYYEHNYDPANGTILMIDLSSRQFWVHKFGKMHKSISEKESSYLINNTRGLLKNDKFSEAVDFYIDSVDRILSGEDVENKSFLQSLKYESWKADYYYNDGSNSFNYSYKTKPMVSIIVSIISTIIVLGIMFSRHKGIFTVNNRTYEQEFKRTKAREEFTHTTVSRRTKSKSSSGGGSGSSGGGGSF